MAHNHPSRVYKNLGTKTRKVWARGLTDAARAALSDHDLKKLDLDIAYALFRFEPPEECDPFDKEDDLDELEAELDKEQPGRDD